MYIVYQTNIHTYIVHGWPLLQHSLLTVSRLLNKGSIAQIMCLHNGWIQRRKVQRSYRNIVVPAVYTGYIMDH